MDTPNNAAHGTGADLHKQSVMKLAALEAWMAPFFAKLPHLPADILETLAKIAPWLALIFGILGIAGILSAGMFAAVMSPAFYAMGMSQVTIVVSLLTGIVACVLDLCAYKPLLARKKMGWNFIFYAQVLSALSLIVGIIFSSVSIMNILGQFIGFWLLFEVRGLYKA